MNLLKHLPNIITLGNLTCGLLGIILLFTYGPAAAAPMIFWGAALDFLDGFAARALKAYSPIGKELDSLADVVTFGALPALILMQLIANASSMDDPIRYLGLLLALFSALRLAKFNVDTEQSENFIGLPTPASAILIASIALVTSGDFFSMIYSNFGFLIALALILPLMLVMPLPLFSLKFKSFYIKSNSIRYLFLLISLILLITFAYSGILLIILLYVTLSIISPPKKTV